MTDLEKNIYNMLIKSRSTTDRGKRTLAKKIAAVLDGEKEIIRKEEAKKQEAKPPQAKKGQNYVLFTPEQALDNNKLF